MANHGPVLATMFAPFASHLHAPAHREAGPSEFCRTRAYRKEQLLESLRESLSFPQCILSGEGMLFFPAASLDVLRALLAPRFSRLRVFAYVRDPGEFMASLFQQRLKHEFTTFDLKKKTPGYRRKFEKFEKIFGEENVEYRLFRSERFPGRCVVRDFSERFHCDLPETLMPRENTSICFEAVCLLYLYRKVLPVQPLGTVRMRKDQRLVALLQQLPGSSVRFHQELVDPMLSKRKPDLDWMDARLDHPLCRTVPDSSVGTIRSEEDLLGFDRVATAEALRNLRPDLSDLFDRLPEQQTLEQVSAWVGRLREALSSDI